MEDKGYTVKTADNDIIQLPKEAKDFIPRQTHEGDMARLERSNKRLSVALLIALVVIVVALIANNVVWMNFESHRQDETNKVIYEIQKE